MLPKGESRMNTTIYASTSGEGPDVLLLHGLFGQGSNLRGIARALEAEFRVHCLDLPDHGRSLWLDEASLAHYARAIVLWMRESDISSAHVVGHSLGGKVAMQLALSHASLVNRLVIADIAPAAYAGQHSEVFDALQQVVEAGCESRQAAGELLAGLIQDPGVRGYLLMGLERRAGTYDWRFNVQGLLRGYTQLCAAPDFDRVFTGPTLFLRGADSGYVRAEHESTMKQWFSGSHLVSLAKAGHWLHVDQPEAFCDQVRCHLRG
jgi:esterase